MVVCGQLHTSPVYTQGKEPIELLDGTSDGLRVQTTNINNITPIGIGAPVIWPLVLSLYWQGFSRVLKLPLVIWKYGTLK
jgi:hypothetical protein